MICWKIAAIILLLLIALYTASSQFAYPLDPNPPQVNSTFSCFACEGDGCDVRREQGTHDIMTCTGPRVACWTIKNLDTTLYTRTCVQPNSIRQGVFCNRHMEGREFCFASITPRGRELVCGKCCLSNYCNDGKLQGTPDDSLQSCIACQGDREMNCNEELSLELENSTYVEQCLLPNSDCWTERRRNNDESVYFRGCQLRTCDGDNLKETCSTTSGQETCQVCCQGKLCNRFTSSAPSATSNGWSIFFFVIAYLFLA